MATVKNVPTASLERPLTIIAQDPSILASDGGVLTTQVSIPAERLEAGPWGHRIQVIDYDASSKSYYAPCRAIAFDTPWNNCCVVVGSVKFASDLLAIQRNQVG